MSTRRILILSAALAATGGASLAAGSDPEPERTGPSGGQQPVQSVESAHAARYAVLRREGTPQDRLPPEPQAFVRSSMTDVTGAAPGLARRAQVAPSGTVVHVVPGRGHICLYAAHPGVEGGTGTCNDSAAAERGFLAGSDSPSPGITRVFGLVPDGVDEVSLRARDGGVERVAPEGNVYVFETAREPGQVEWGDAVVRVGGP